MLAYKLLGERIGGQLKGVGHICKVSTKAEKMPSLRFKAGELCLNGGAARKDFGALTREPLAQVLHPPKGTTLTELVGADRDSIKKLLNFAQTRLGRNNCADAVACEAIGF